MVVSGDFQVKSVKIAPSIANNENLANIVMNTTNSALVAAKSAMQSKMQEITGGLNIPGLF